MEFICKSCESRFISQGTKKEWIDYVVGPCMKYVADCPDCGQESDEFRRPKPEKMATAPCGIPANHAPSCGMGGCGCG